MASAFGRRATRFARRWGDPVTQIASAELLYPETALVIALVETGGFTARWMMKHHNWFGFRPSSRKNHSGVQHGYATYATAGDMLLDYAEWEQINVQRFGLYTEARFRAWLPTYYVPPVHRSMYTAKLHQRYAELNTYE